MLGSYSTVQSQFTIGVSIGGIGFRFIDTAGLREAQDVIEAIEAILENKPKLPAY